MATGPAVRDGTRARLVRATFNAAAEHFDDPQLFFWDHCGARTVALAGVAPGHRVLDVCCGTGASALPAAARVAPVGSVVGIDIADGPLARARVKAARQGLTNVRFVRGEMTALDQPDATYDVVLCVLGLYFAVELPAVVAELWRVVRPGGTLAVTTWGARALEPGNAMYLDAVGAVRPDLRPASIPWERINSPEKLAGVFAAAGLPAPAVERETVTRPTDPDAFWTVILGSGYRLLVDAMDRIAASRVRAALRERMTEERVDRLTADLLYARAAKRA
ncbi:MAG: methyltransferase domain-containing protein [Streptosporangiales bacterium]|nr:methyltransferase domain-containing protein [Streptosporangiales bacterium]